MEKGRAGPIVKVRCIGPVLDILAAERAGDAGSLAWKYSLHEGRIQHNGHSSPTLDEKDVLTPQGMDLAIH